MGLITDKDAEEAEQAVEIDFPYIKKELKMEFLNGFLKAWRSSRNSGPDTYDPKKPELNLTPHQILTYLGQGLEKDAENFGRAFGALIGTIEYSYKEPEKLFRTSWFEWVVLGINSIKLRAHFYQMAMLRIDKLSQGIKLEQLTQEARRNYGALISNLR